jgi:hypothetical protein
VSKPNLVCRLVHEKLTRNTEMASFFTHLLAPFKSSRHRDLHVTSRRTSQPGPYATGATIEAQTPARRRHFWQSASTIWSGATTPATVKTEKPSRGEKMGTLSGVFIPTTLNVMSILMYLRVSYPGDAAKYSTGLFSDKVE